ncbi:hypothetical protein [Janibacter melonis]|uniref:hypothetical protein n=1 Tax=Janibacter melonis TaxID=262209 RepID=UPI0017813993
MSDTKRPTDGANDGPDHVAAAFDGGFDTSGWLAGTDFTKGYSSALAGFDTSGWLAGTDFTKGYSSALAGIDLPTIAHRAGFEATWLSQPVAGFNGRSAIRAAVGFSRHSWSYQHAFDALVDSLRLPDETRASFAPIPSSDDRAYELIRHAAPEIAAAISDASDGAGLPFWAKRQVRNAFAWVVAMLIVLAHVGGTALPPPFNAIAAALLGAMGFTAPAAFKRVRGDQGSQPTR